jgi:hypothetical protein
MIKTTRAQREALRRVYRRALEDQRRSMSQPEYISFTYRKFRETVQPGPGCIMVPFASIWLGIEPDGHTHS